MVEGEALDWRDPSPKNRMILRLLLMIGLIWLVVQLWRNWQRGQALRQQRPDESFQLTSRCRGCGVYLPASALSKDGRCGKCSD